MYIKKKSYDILNACSIQDVGHLDFLEKARKQGDYLIVGMHSDPVCYGFLKWTVFFLNILFFIL